MRRLRFAARADADIDDVLTESLTRWGEAAHVRYAALLAAAFQRIATTPLAPTTRAHDTLAAGVRSFPLRVLRGHGVRAPVHVVYYRVSADFIDVLRVLHERMEPAAHLRTKPAAGRSRRR